jgi:hypothetical protein
MNMRACILQQCGPCMHACLCVWHAGMVGCQHVCVCVFVSGCVLVSGCVRVYLSPCLSVSLAVSVSVSVSVVSGLTFAYMRLGSGHVRSASAVLFAESYLRRPYKDCSRMGIWSTSCICCAQHLYPRYHTIKNDKKDNNNTIQRLPVHGSLLDVLRLLCTTFIPPVYIWICIHTYIHIYIYIYIYI